MASVFHERRTSSALVMMLSNVCSMVGVVEVAGLLIKVVAFNVTVGWF